MLIRLLKLSVASYVIKQPHRALPNDTVFTYYSILKIIIAVVILQLDYVTTHHYGMGAILR